MCSPYEYSGMGISDIRLHSNALKARWLWKRWNEPNKAWHGFNIVVDKEVIDLFRPAPRLPSVTANLQVSGMTTGGMESLRNIASLCCTKSPEDARLVFMMPSTIMVGLLQAKPRSPNLD